MRRFDFNMAQYLMAERMINARLREADDDKVARARQDCRALWTKTKEALWDYQGESEMAMDMGKTGGSTSKAYLRKFYQTYRSYRQKLEAEFGVWEGAVAELELTDPARARSERAAIQKGRAEFDRVFRY